jgi:outer membrane protein TolC
VRGALALVAALAIAPPGLAGAPAPAVAAAQAPAPSGTESPDPAVLELDEVLRSIEETYPPLLAGLIERDVAEGRLRSARGLYDLDLFGKLKTTPDGYYEYTTVEAGAEQFLGIWGTTVYGGYRLTTGETLPDYYAERTQGDGELAMGLRLPLLKGGRVDDARAGVALAGVEARAVDPYLDRQRLDFVRAGSVAWAKWVASGLKLRYARELLRLANDRTAALEQQVAGGLRADIVLVDNRRLVVSREIEVLDAERAFRGAALSLSMFFRDAAGTPIVADEARLPATLPDWEVEEIDPEVGVARAHSRRPELARLGLDLEAAEVELDLARNSLLPTLDARIEAARPRGEDLYADRSVSELRAGLDFKLPLQRRRAGGKTVMAEARRRQLQQEVDFAREKIDAEVRDAALALETALGQVDRAGLNVALALELQQAEQALFQAGSSDLLALQIREQAAFDARVKAATALQDAVTAWADYRAASAAGLAGSEAR